MKTNPKKCLTIGVLLLSIALCVEAQTPAGARGSPPSGPGPGDKQAVDAAAADRGKTTYIAECITCHGPKARGTESRPELDRSGIVRLDRYGNYIGPLF